MIKYFLKNKVKKEMKNSKFIVFSGGVFLGYLSYKSKGNGKLHRLYRRRQRKYNYIWWKSRQPLWWLRCIFKINIYSYINFHML